MPKRGSKSKGSSKSNEDSNETTVQANEEIKKEVKEEEEATSATATTKVKKEVKEEPATTTKGIKKEVKGKKTPRRKFDYSLNYKELDCRAHPELYCIGKGEQGVLMVQPYKAEILPLWRFKNPEIARDSSQQIYALFKKYKSEGDFVGMDMARKFLMMGWTRSRRYANHASGKKYSDVDKDLTTTKKEKVTKKAAEASKDFNSRNKAHKLKTLTKEVAPREEDPVKAESAVIFREKYLKAFNDPDYQQACKDFIAKYG